MRHWPKRARTGQPLRGGSTAFCILESCHLRVLTKFSGQHCVHAGVGGRKTHIYNPASRRKTKTALQEQSKASIHADLGMPARLELVGNLREWALFKLAADSKLRGCDFVCLKVIDLVSNERVRERIAVIQSKTNRPVQFPFPQQFL